MTGTFTRSDAARLVQLLAETLAVTDKKERVTVEIAENGNVFIDDRLAATIRTEGE